MGVHDKTNEFTVEQIPYWINLCSKCQFSMTSVWQCVLNSHKVLFRNIIYRNMTNICETKKSNGCVLSRNTWAWDTAWWISSFINKQGKENPSVVLFRLSHSCTYLKVKEVMNRRIMTENRLMLRKENSSKSVSFMFIKPLCPKPHNFSF